MYRTATPNEISDCIYRQVVEPCELAESPEYRNKPAKLRALIRDIRIGAKSNADWLRSQQRSVPCIESANFDLTFANSDVFFSS